MVRHEGGHNLDHILGANDAQWFTSSPKFLDAYARDLERQKLMPKISAVDEARFKFYAGRPPFSEFNGPRETFAELSAIRLGGGADSADITKLLIKRFPEVWSLVQRKIDSLY